MKDLSSPLSSLRDSRLNKIAWDIHCDPTIPGELKFIADDQLIPIPQDSLILSGCIRPLSYVKTINVPIAIATTDSKLKSETRFGYLKYNLKIEDDTFITLTHFLKAIYDFYETQITEEQYNLLISEKKQKKRQELLESFKTSDSTLNYYPFALLTTNNLTRY